MFTVGWFGYGGSSGLVEFLFEDLEELGIKLKTCHEYLNATVKYTPETVFEFIDSCDVIILPARLRLQPAKSVNRLALAWSRKKACVVAPLDAYTHYVDNGVNAIFASTKEEWLSAIIKLRDDQEYRGQLALAGYQTALDRLNPVNYSATFFDTINSILNPNVSKDSFVQVIVPHYANRLDYLSHAIESIALTKGPKRDILIVSSSKINPQNADFIKKYNVRVIHVQNRLTFSEANNLGIKNADKRATHFLLMNDDVIVNDTFLENLVSTLTKNGNNFILNPYSNCDKGWLHNDSLTTQSGKDLYPNMQLDNFTADELDSFRTYGFNGKGEDLQNIRTSPFCAFYCTLIPKEVFDKVGMLNTIFKNGGEDLDFCERAKRFGFECFWTTQAGCFHFGGKTRKFSEDENFKEHHDEDKINNSLINKRWRKSKKKIGIWTGPAWEQWDLDTYLTSGIGGSEQCAAKLAITAAANGCNVYMYGSHERKEQYGVELVPWDQFIPEEEYFDLFVASRNVNCIDDRLRSKNILVWVHDIWLLSGKQISPYQLNRVNKFVCLSPWHVDFFSDYHGIPKDKITVIPNGVNTELFKEPNVDEKIFGKLIYSSSPDRGLDNLLYLMPFVKDKIPDLHLDIYYGFHNYDSAVRKRNNPAEIDKLEKLKELINQSKDFAHMHGRISQPELAKKWHQTYLWWYPSQFSETYCCLGNTNIFLADGCYKSICQIQEGDVVKTHRGSGKVTKTMSRNVKETIYKIKVKNLKDPVEVTGDHPILALTRKDNECIRFGRMCKKTYSGCTLYKYRDKKDKNKLHILTEPCKKYDTKFEPKWVSAKDLVKSDFVCVTKNRINNNPPNFHSVLGISNFEYRQDYNENHRAIKIMDDFKIDEDFLEFCGWYMAEGVFDGRSVITFSLHINEIDESNFIKSQISRIGLNYREDIRDFENTRVIVTYSVILGKFFAPFGRISKDRKIPQWIKDLDPQYLRYFLRGLFHGDGYSCRNVVNLECASPYLIYDLFEVFLKVRCITHTSNSKKYRIYKDAGGKICRDKTKTLPAYAIGCSLSQNKELFSFFGYTPDEKGIENLYLEDDNYVYLPISKITKYEFTGDVYNFEVEGDNSYLANGIVVHNCLTAKEAQLSATPILCSSEAALQTTVGEHGIQVGGWAYSYDSRVKFVDEAVKLLQNKDYWLQWSKKSYAGSHGISWDNRWEQYWKHWL